MIKSDMHNKINRFIFLFIIFLPLIIQNSRAVDVRSKKVWNQTIKGYIYSTPMIADITGDGVYDIVIGDQKGNVSVLHGQTGKKIFETTVKGSINASPIVYDFDNNNLFDILIFTDQGKIYRIDHRNQTNSILWEWTAESSINYTPVLYQNSDTSRCKVIFTDEDTNVYCLGIDKAGAELIWKVSVGLLIRTSPVLLHNSPSENWVVIGCTNGDILVLDAETGRRINKYTIPGRSRLNASPAVGDVNKDGISDIVVGSEDQKIYVYSGKSPDPVWRPYKTNGEIIYSPILSSNTTSRNPLIICVSMDNNCYVLDGTSGVVLWTFPLDSKPSTQPIVIDVNRDNIDDIIIGTESGNVHIIDGSTQANLETTELKEPIGSILAGDIDNNSTIDILVSTQQKVSLFNTTIPITGNTLLWPTIYGNLHRSDQVDFEYLMTINRKMTLLQQEVDALFNQAMKYKEAKDSSKALETFKKVLDLNTNHPEAAAQINKLQFNERRPIILKTVLGIIILILLVTGWWWLRRSRGKGIQYAMALLQENRTDEALKKYNKLIHHKEFDLLPELAAAYARKGDISQDAISAYEQVIKLKDYTITPTEIHYRLAQAYCKENRLDDNSRLVYEMALQYKKDDKDILRAYGRASRAKNDTYTLVKQYEKLYNLGDKDTEVINNLARGYLESTRTDPFSMQIYQQAVELSPDDRELVIKVADVYLQHNRFDEQAVQVYTIASTMNPDKIDYPLAIAQYKIQKNKYEDALTLVTPIMEKNLDHGISLTVMGRTKLGLKEYQPAIDCLEKSLQKFPADNLILRDLAFAYAGAGNTGDRALEIYQQAAKNEPTSISLRAHLAHAYVDRCDRDKAMESLISWEQLDPKNLDKILNEYLVLSKSFPANMDIRKKIFNFQLNLELLKEANESVLVMEESGTLTKQDLIKAFSDLLKKDPENLDIRLKRAGLLMDIEKPDDAITDLEWIQQERSNDSKVHDLLEKLYSDKLTQNPNNLSFHFKLGILLYLRGDIERAIEHLQRTVKEGYREQESAKYLGLCFQKRGMLDLAYRQLTKLPMDNDMKDILYDLANDYTEMHQFSKALTVLEQIYSEDINYKDLKATITKLREQTSSQGPVETSFRTGLGINDVGTMIEQDNSATVEEKRRYEILKELGRGNMGIVCLARDKELDEIVALKFLPQELHYDAMIVERFKQEVRSTRRLSHPNIVRIHDMGDERGRKFISMEYIDGRTLKDILYEKKKFTPQEVVDIATQLCAALDYAHRMKVVHRDIKPANIMMTRDGVVKIMDFGIASMLERAGLTQTGALIGTPLYMSPEQSEGKAVDGRSDIYSMGAMLYELISGTPPFYSGNISYQHVHVVPPPLENIPEFISKIIMKTLSKSPDERYQTAAECLRDFEKTKDENQPGS